MQDSGESYFCHTCNAFVFTVGMKRKSITRIFSRPTEFLCFCVGVDDILETKPFIDMAEYPVTCVADVNKPRLHV